MEIFKLLDKSNCRLCGEKTCLAFAGKVILGQKDIRRCPNLDDAVLERFAGGVGVHPTAVENRDEYIETLKRRVAALDLQQAARRIKAVYQNGRLTLKVLGKDFSITSKGELSADIHVNPWVAAPFLQYVLVGQGKTPSKQWASFRELKNGRERYALFQRRCEGALKRVADTYPGLFDDMVHIFGGRQVERQFQSDISVVLHPLPLVPLMVCYWRPDDGLDSSLNLYFDRSTEANLDIDSLYTLAAGLAQMFERLAIRHGY
jgi:hypothetical protein